VSLRSATTWERPETVNDAGRVRLHLRRVVESPAFQGSQRCQTFLAYVVEKMLQGQVGSLKERTLAVEVFGRSCNANLTDDTIVRVSAREVRRRLAQYYGSAQGESDEIRIDLPTGSYIPRVRLATNAAADEPPVPATPTNKWQRLQVRTSILLGTALTMLVALLFGVGSLPTSRDSFEAFWNPIFRSGNTVLIVVAHPIVYHPSERAQRLNDLRSGALPTVLQQPIKLPAAELDGSDMVPVFDQYVGFGDLLASTELNGFLVRHNKAARFRLASRVELVDLKESPTILIGAFTNRWTAALAQELHFRFAWAQDRIPEIVEAGVGRRWALPAAPANGTSDEDFLLVSRVLDSNTGKPLVVLAGLKQFGTGAAGHLLTDPVEWRVLAKLLPLGWQTRSVQLILRVRVIGGEATTPELIASYQW